MKRVLLFLGVLSLLVSCGGVDNPDNGGGGKKGSLELKCDTDAAADVTENSATIKGRVTLKTDQAVNGSAWFFFGTDKANLTTTGQKISTQSITSNIYTETTFNISATMNGLLPETTYYYILEASVGGINASGNVMSFTTGKAPVPEATDLVDLGLSVKWRAWNLGATKPEEFGDFYAWGEVDTKEKYQADTYKWSDATFEKMTKYNATDGLTKLSAADDAAAVKLGGKYRMPTAEEFKELRDKCTWEYGTLNDVAGYKVSATNGNSIFLPLCGMRYEDNRLHKDYGLYWSSTLNAEKAHGTALSLKNGEVKEYDIQRFVGFSIRPVSD